MNSIHNTNRTTNPPFDLEANNKHEDVVVRSSRWKPYTLGVAGIAAVAGAVTAVVLLTNKHKSVMAPAPAPIPAPNPLPTPTPIHVLPPPPPVPTPAPVNTNATGFLNVLPFTMAETSAFYGAQPVAGGEKFAVVLTDASETCETLTAGPVRSAGIQEMDFCQVTNGSSIQAQNGRIIQNGEQYQSTALSLNGTIGTNGVLNGTFVMNTTNIGYVTGNFSAEPCNTLVYDNFCNLQN